MNLYRISQTANRGYDTFDSAVVSAESEDEARLIHPRGHWGPHEPWDGKDEMYSNWCAASDVTVELVGVATEGTKRGVICASFNAG